MSWGRWLKELIHPPTENGEGAQRQEEIQAARRRQAELEARARVVQLHLDVMHGGRPRSDP